MAGFILRNQGKFGPKIEAVDKTIILNSKTTTIGDLVHLEDGFVDIAAAGERLWGVVVGFEVGGSNATDGDGIGLENAKSGTDYDGTFTEGGIDVGKYVAISDNQTDKKVRAVIDVSPFAVYSNTPDATIGTTTGSNLKGNYTDIIDEDQVDENNSTNAFTTIAQLLILGVDSLATTNGLYMIMERQYMGG